jgi:hypothetical protein
MYAVIDRRPDEWMNDSSTQEAACDRFANVQGAMQNGRRDPFDNKMVHSSIDQKDVPSGMLGYLEVRSASDEICSPDAC